MCRSLFLSALFIIVAWILSTQATISPVYAQFSTATPASVRAAFDQQLLRFSQEWSATILLEDVPSSVRDASDTTPPRTDFKAFLQQYHLGAIEAADVVLLYKQADKENLLTSITLAEAALTMEEVRKLIAPFAAPQKQGEVGGRDVIAIIRDLSTDDRQRAQTEGILIQQLSRVNQRRIANLVGSNYINTRLGGVEEAGSQLKAALAPSTRIIGNALGKEVVCKVTAPEPDAQNAYTFDPNFFGFESIAIEKAQPVTLLPYPSGQKNALVYEGTIRAVFRSLAQAKPEMYQSLEVEDSLADKPLLVYAPHASALHLCEGVAQLYNLRVREWTDTATDQKQILLARYKSRTVKNVREMRQELLRILPAPLIRLVHNPAIPIDSVSPPGDKATKKERVKYEYDLQTTQEWEVMVFAGKLDHQIPLIVSSKLNALVADALKQGNTVRGVALLKESPAIYNVLVANSLIAVALPDLNELLKEPPFAITNPASIRVYVEFLDTRLPDGARVRDAIVRVEGESDRHPGIRSSTSFVAGLSPDENL